ncbi:MAG: hypothetical protein Ct9H300mP1_01310 [Planctomycetaceae bacterium]|nr:MAG: hypothetical protein Ct9H300mP1_01310 [Planctomycetaceae bacterium]
MSPSLTAPWAEVTSSDAKSTSTFWNLRGRLVKRSPDLDRLPPCSDWYDSRAFWTWPISTCFSPVILVDVDLDHLGETGVILSKRVRPLVPQNIIWFIENTSQAARVTAW